MLRARPSTPPVSGGGSTVRGCIRPGLPRANMAVACLRRARRSGVRYAPCYVNCIAHTATYFIFIIYTHMYKGVRVKGYGGCTHTAIFVVHCTRSTPSPDWRHTNRLWLRQVRAKNLYVCT